MDALCTMLFSGPKLLLDEDMEAAQGPEGPEGPEGQDSVWMLAVLGRCETRTGCRLLLVASAEEDLDSERLNVFGISERTFS